MRVFLRVLRFSSLIKIDSRSITSGRIPSYRANLWYLSLLVGILKLAVIPKAMFTLKATDQYPNNVNKQDIDRVLARGRSETDGLDYELYLKERVKLTANIDI